VFYCRETELVPRFLWEGHVCF